MSKVFTDIDFALFLPACFLVGIGGLILMSVSPESFPRQFLYIGFALAAFLLFSKLDFKVLLAFAPWLYVVSLSLLLITLVIGNLTRGATRWIEIGSFTLQASEIAKPLLLVFLAWFLAKSGNFRRFPFAAAFVFTAGLFILRQPDLGSALVVLAGFAGAVIVAGIPFSFLTASIVLFGGASPFLWNFLADYQRARILSFISPMTDPLGSGYNAIQAMIAVGSGEVFGRGLGQGTQSQLAFLPERHTDFIFAALSEELGLLGALAVILAFLLLLWRIIGLLRLAKEDFEKVFLGGAFATVFFQAAVNIGMNLGLLPITGIPLPFVSSGGSSLLAMSVILGICSSIGQGLSKRASLGIIRS